MRTDPKIYNDPNQCELLDAVVLNNVEETKELTYGNYKGLDGFMRYITDQAKQYLT